jgi:membrane protease YdiL (CAAX protease family)
VEPSTGPIRLEQAADPLEAIPWTKRDLFWAAILGVAGVLGMLVLAVLALSLYAAVTHTAVSASLTGVLIFTSELGLLLPVWVFGVRKYRLPWSSVGFRRFDVPRALGLGCLVLLASFAFNVVYALVLGLFSLQAQPDVLPAFGGGLSGLSWALLVGGLVAPVVEEAFFRGYLFVGLRQHLGRRQAVLLSAGLFALAHVLPTSWPPIFVLGILFALLYEHTASAWPAIIIHSSINVLAFLASYLLSLLPP